MTPNQAACAIAESLGSSLSELRSWCGTYLRKRDRDLTVLMLCQWGAPGLTHKRIAEIMGRNPCTVTAALLAARNLYETDRAFRALHDKVWGKLGGKLGYVKDFEPMARVRPNWTPKEEALLEGGRANFSTERIAALAKTLDRSPDAIRNRIDRLAAFARNRSDRFEQFMERRCVGCGGFFDTREVARLACGACPSPRKYSADLTVREAVIGLS